MSALIEYSCRFEPAFEVCNGIDHPIGVPLQTLAGIRMCHSEAGQSRRVRGVDSTQGVLHRQTITGLQARTYRSEPFVGQPEGFGVRLSMPNVFGSDDGRE